MFCHFLVQNRLFSDNSESIAITYKRKTSSCQYNFDIFSIFVVFYYICSFCLYLVVGRALDRHNFRAKTYQLGLLIFFYRGTYEGLETSVLELSTGCIYGCCVFFVWT